MSSKDENMVILIGNCRQVPATKFMSSGGVVSKVSVATSEKWKDMQSGQQRERTEWHRVVFFNGLAEEAGENLHKGTKIYVKGRLRTHKWLAKDGIDRQTTEIMASELHILDGRRAGGETMKDVEEPKSDTKSQIETALAAANFSDLEDRIPFD